MRFEETVGISHLLRLTDHAMKRRLDRALAPWRLSAAQYMALSAIEAAGTLTNAALARQCSVTPQTANRLIDGLVTAGLIKRREDPAHGRKLALGLTKKAATVVCEAHVAVNALELESLSGLTKAQVKIVQSALRDILNCLDAGE